MLKWMECSQRDTMRVRVYYIYATLAHFLLSIPPCQAPLFACCEDFISPLSLRSIHEARREAQLALVA